MTPPQKILMLTHQAAIIGGIPAYCPTPEPTPHTKQHIPYKTATLGPTFNGDHNKDLKEKQHGPQNEREIRPGFIAVRPPEGTS